MSIDSILELESVIQNKVEMDVKSLRRSERTNGIENDKDYQSTVKVKVEDQPTESTSERQVRHHRTGFTFPPPMQCQNLFL